jgi:hypothetical protein
MWPATHQESLARGLLYYWTGKLCKKGHIALRFASNRQCTLCAKEQSREWYSNPANAEAVAAKFSRYRAKNLEYERGRSTEWRKQNPAVSKELTRRWREANKEHFSAVNKAWCKSNPDRRRSYLNSYRSRKTGASGKHNAADIAALYRFTEW